MILLHILHELAPTHGWQLTVAHLNHALRGRSSDADERLVRRTAEKLKLPVRVGRVDVRRFARLHGLSLEMAARKVRHDFLARTAARLGISRIALAHQADDQVELFFLRLLRGSSGEGLAGMKWRSPSPSNPKVELVRPLLDQPRSALLDYAAEMRIRFREDASNASLDIQRNRLRHELLPLLRAKYQPALSKIILRTADILGADADLAAQAARAWLKQEAARATENANAAAERPSVLGLAKPFESLPVAVQRRVVQLQLVALGVAADYSLVEELRSAPDKPVTVGPGKRAPSVAVVRDPRGTLRLDSRAARDFNADSSQVVLTRPAGQTEFGGAVMRWRFSRVTQPWKPLTATGRESFDADKVGPYVVLRHWQPGDRFQPIGMSRPIKLQDFFTNQKVPRSRRRQLVLATTAQGEVFWVEGMRIAEGVKVTKATIRRLHWSWERP